MCCFDRPKDYIVPQNYTVPESERARLQREAELDQLATEVRHFIIIYRAKIKHQMQIPVYLPFRLICFVFKF